MPILENLLAGPGPREVNYPNKNNEFSVGWRAATLH